MRGELSRIVRILGVAGLVSLVPLGAAFADESRPAATPALVPCAPAADALFTPVGACLGPAAAGQPAGCLALDDPLSPETAGKGKPPRTACCDPSLEPGTGGNPFCFEGHTCCSDGVWRCNNPDGTPSCKAGQVCDAGCGSRGDSCSSGEDCCSGNCKGGRCR